MIPGGSFEFRVTDLFAKRHYWCSAKYGVSEFLFKAYGEGAPRENNQISLNKEGAFINGKMMNIEDSPMKVKLPPKKGSYQKDRDDEMIQENDANLHQQQGQELEEVLGPEVPHLGPVVQREQKIP